jgi:serine O-acetyltransferase
VFKNLKIDIKSFCDDAISFKKMVFLFFMSTDFKAVLYYRIACWFHRRKLKYLAYYIKYLAKKRYGVELSPIAEIGPGFRLVHSLGTVIGNHVKIGSFSTIYQQVTIGTVNVQQGAIDYPVIGDHAVIYAGAKVLGGIKIGNNVVIAANAVVIRDVSDNCVVGGIPAKILK